MMLFIIKIFFLSLQLYLKKIIKDIGNFSKDTKYAIDFEFILRVKKIQNLPNP